MHLTATSEDGEKSVTLDTTLTHPFYVVGYGFKYASELKIGDKLRSVSGDIYEVSATETEHFDNPVKVYNFEVDEWHTYAVSEEGIVVHNANSSAYGNKTEDEKKKTSTKKVDKKAQEKKQKEQPGPKPKGTGPHNLKIEKVASEVNDGVIIAGGGRGYPPEAIIKTPNGLKQSRRPDILVQKYDGSLYGINVGKTTAKGAPVKREVEALYDLEHVDIPMWFVSYDEDIQKK